MSVEYAPVYYGLLKAGSWSPPCFELVRMRLRNEATDTSGYTVRHRRQGRKPADMNLKLRMRSCFDLHVACGLRPIVVYT